MPPVVGPGQVVGVGEIDLGTPEGLALYAGLSEWPARRRNTVRYVFLHSAARSVLEDWEGAATTGVANLQHWAGTDPDGPDLRRVREELAAASADFRRLWDGHPVRPRRSSHKVFHHLAVGDLRMRHQVVVSRRLAHSSEPLPARTGPRGPDRPARPQPGHPPTNVTRPAGEARGTRAGPPRRTRGAFDVTRPRTTPGS
ncbi:MmyB family transcriptional regulator [Sphaerisporangium siamense]|uniref:MmyB family transcriptional regulator n=1 Tax=Sphaerisporangium siamense TaxID=795645 RepID=UPI0035E28E18